MESSSLINLALNTIAPLPNSAFTVVSTPVLPAAEPASGAAGGINARGDITGFWQDATPQANDHGFIIGASSGSPFGAGFQSFNAGASGTFPMSINDAGQIAGVDGNGNPFLRNPDGSSAFLPSLGFRPGAVAINNNGVFLAVGGGGSGAFVIGNQVFKLPACPTAPDCSNSTSNYSYSSAINSQGQIVGGISSTISGTSNAVIFTPTISAPIQTNLFASPCINSLGCANAGSTVFSSGDVNTDGPLALGTGGGDGTLTVGSATLTTSSLVVGQSSAGSATVQSGGTINTTSLIVGGQSSGGLTIDGSDGPVDAVVHADSTFVGDGLNGTVTEGKNASLFTNTLTIGTGGSFGTYTIGNNGNLAVNGDLTLGANAGGLGNLKVSDDATASVAGTLHIGDNGGTMTVAGNANVQLGAAVIGQFAGGTSPLSIQGNGTVIVGNVTNPFASGGGLAIGPMGNLTINLGMPSAMPAVQTTGAFNLAGTISVGLASPGIPPVGGDYALLQAGSIQNWQNLWLRDDVVVPNSPIASFQPPEFSPLQQSGKIVLPSLGQSYLNVEVFNSENPSNSYQEISLRSVSPVSSVQSVTDMVSAQNFVYSTMASDAARVSQSVYTLDTDQEPQGFAILRFVSNAADGFQAAAYQSPDGKIYVAFRGTLVLGDNAQTIADFNQTLPSNLDSVLGTYSGEAAQFLGAVIHDNGGSSSNIILTGHSLGGAMAQILGYETGLQAITFNTVPVGSFVQTLGALPAPLSQYSFPDHNGILNGLDNIINIKNQFDPSNWLLSNILRVPQIGQQITVQSDLDGGATALLFQTLATLGSASDAVACMSELISGGIISDCGAAASSLTSSATSLGQELVHDHAMDTMVDLLHAGAQVTGYKDAGFGIVTPVTLPVNAPVSTSVSATTGAITEVFNSPVFAGAASLFDPAGALGYVFQVGAGDPAFASFTGPLFGNDTGFEIDVFEGGTWQVQADVTALVPYFFSEPDGVDEFRALFLDQTPPLDLTDPIFELSFEGDGQFTGTITTLVETPNQAPEPGSLWLLGSGLVAFMIISRKRTNRQPT